MIYICIPSRDERRTIGVLLWKIREVMQELKRDYRLLVLDDGSNDDTRGLLAKYKMVVPLSVLREDRPVGYGHATENLIREAVRQTRYPKRDAIIVMQGDFTDHPDDLPALIKKFEGGLDIVAGVPAEDNDPPPRPVRAVRWLANVVLRRVGRWRATAGDPLSGFRAYRAIVPRKALRAAGDRPLVTRDGWAANAELLAALAPFARQVGEVPLRRRYDLRRRPSRFRVVPTVLEMLRLRGTTVAGGGEP